MTQPPIDLSQLAQQATPTAEPVDKKPQLDGPETGTPFVPPSPAAGAGRSPAPPRRRSSPTRQTPDPGAPVSPDEARRFIKDDKEEYRPGVLVKPIQDFYTALGAGVLPFNVPVGTALVQNGRTCAEAWDNAARQDPAIRKALMQLVRTSVWGTLIAVHMPIGMAIAVTFSPAAERVMMQAMPKPSEDGETVNPVSNGWVRNQK